MLAISNFTRVEKGNSAIVFLLMIKKNQHKVWELEKDTKINSSFLLMKSSKKYFILLAAFSLIIWVMTSTKNFEKIAILKI